MKKVISFLFSMLAFAGMHAQTLPGTYVLSSIVTGLQYPSDFDWTPDGRYLVTQKGGNANPASNATIKIFQADGTPIGTFYDLTDSVDAAGEHGLHGIAIDPDFTNNHYVYAYYTYRNPAKTVMALRVVRFTEVSNVGTAPKLIFNQIYSTTATNHVGGIIRFRPSQPDKLYIEIGDLAYNQGNPTLNYANKLNSPYGKIHRINKDGTIPTDNPYYDDGKVTTGNDDRIWSYGHRNMFGMCFSPVTDSMYESENGLDTWDEFNIIHKGGNYGWASCEGNYKYGTSTPCSDPAFTNPMTTWGAPLPSVTGCLYYSGTVMPEFNNHIIVADNDNGILYDLTLGNAPAYDIVTNKASFADIVSGGVGAGLTTIRQGKDGCIYAMKGGYTTSGIIYKICHKSTEVSSTDGITDDLGQNYPNPTNGKTQIDYSIVQPSMVTITLMDITGRTIRTLLNAQVQPGKHSLQIDGLSELSTGSYLYKMDVLQNDKVSFSQTKQLIIEK
jgi:glucose/arabinose dehydrogenase